MKENTLSIDSLYESPRLVRIQKLIPILNKKTFLTKMSLITLEYFDYPEFKGEEIEAYSLDKGGI